MEGNDCTKFETVAVTRNTINGYKGHFESQFKASITKNKNPTQVNKLTSTVHIMIFMIMRPGTFHYIHCQHEMKMLKDMASSARLMFDASKEVVEYVRMMKEYIMQIEMCPLHYNLGNAYLFSGQEPKPAETPERSEVVESYISAYISVVMPTCRRVRGECVECA